ncbi:MAG: fructose-bisphosphate aldolase [Thermoproteota archaeon]
MSNIGKSIRLKRIFKEDERTLIVALDHGLGASFVQGLEKPLEVIRKVEMGGADAVLITIGMLKQFYNELPRSMGLILSIPPNANSILVATDLGVHAVKNTFFGSLRDERLSLIHMLALECADHGMPLLAEIVPTDHRTGKIMYELDQVKAVARIAAEYGADFVKTSYTGSTETFREVVEGCPIPIVILGGERMD